MKTKPRCLFLALACAGLPALSACAQTFTNLHSFTTYTYNYAAEANTNCDGSDPHDGLIVSGNTLYGAAENGGDAGDGTVFSVNTDGTGFTVLHSFTSLYPYGTNADGAEPFCTLVLSGNTLYGTARIGGAVGNGTVFSLNTDGTCFTNLHDFSYPNYDSDTGEDTNSDGGNPYAGLILSGNTLYGTTSQNGGSGSGTVFAMNTDGTGFATLHSFTQLVYDSETYVYTNSDGAEPLAGLALSGNTLYGTADSGGASSVGTVFSLNTDGTCFTNLHTFTGDSYPARPEGGVIVSGNTLYGAAMAGGIYECGMVFSLNTDGSDFTTVYNLNDYLGDGQQPQGGLILSGNTLYGTASAGGAAHEGTVFSVNTDGSGYSVLHSFTFGGYDSDTYEETNNDGIVPLGGLFLSGNTLYGTTDSGGIGGSGTLFSVSLPGLPQLAILPSGANVILTWPANAAGYNLQSAPSLVSSAVWTAVSPAPVVVNTNNVVTNPVSGSQQFFRLANP
jgi:uncharacterized repeat protein (TIGR03803 family)